jgi:hypothetical protein
MQSSVVKALAASILALTLGVGIGHYATVSRALPVPKALEVADHPATHETPGPKSESSSPKAIAESTARSDEGQSRASTSEVEALQQKLAAAQKELKAYHEAEKIEPLYDDVETRRKLATEILDLTGSKEQIEKAFSQSAEMMMKNNKDPETKKAVEGIFNKYFSWEAMAPEFVRIYAEVFSTEDMQRISKFYASDAGRLMLEKQPELMSKTMETMQKLNEKNLPKLMEEMQKVLPKPAAK